MKPANNCIHWTRYWGKEERRGGERGRRGSKLSKREGIGQLISYSYAMGLLSISYLFGHPARVPLLLKVPGLG
jgi:hypothetical protein